MATGLIQSAATGGQPPAAPAPEGAAQGGMPQGAFDPKEMRARMDLPDNLKAAYDRTIKAGMKMMFDPKTRAQTMQFMDGPGDEATKIGEGVGSIMLALFEYSNQTMPPQIIIPCGLELIAHAGEVGREAGLPLDDNVMAEAMSQMVPFILEKMGIKPEKIQQMMSGALTEGMQ